MCCCGKPTVNGEPGYRWQPNDQPSIRPVNAPELSESDVLLFDEPGRCGGVDSHCHHYRVVQRFSSVFLLARNGTGDHRVRLSNAKAVHLALSVLDSNGRYWLLNAIFHAQCDGVMDGCARELGRWRKAAAEKRIKTRKVSGGVKVWIEDPVTNLVAVGGRSV